MIREQEVIRGAEDSHTLRYARPTRVIVFLHRAGRAGPFEVVANVNRGHAVFHSLHPHAVSVIGITRQRHTVLRAGHQAVFRIIGEGVGVAAFDALGHVAVQVVGILPNDLTAAVAGGGGVRVSGSDGMENQ